MQKLKIEDYISTLKKENLNYVENILTRQSRKMMYVYGDNSVRNRMMNYCKSAGVLPPFVGDRQQCGQRDEIRTGISGNESARQRSNVFADHAFNRHNGERSTIKLRTRNKNRRDLCVDPVTPLPFPFPLPPRRAAKLIKTASRYPDRVYASI